MCNSIHHIKLTLLFVFLLTGVSQWAVAIVDLDLDGMSDVWERKYGAEAALPGKDYDHDGMTCLEESQAGTDPYDTNSKLSLASSEYYSMAVMLTWTSNKGSLYQVERLNDAGGWEAVGSLVTGTGGVHSIFHKNDDFLSSQFRVREIKAKTFSPLPNDAHDELDGIDSDGDGIDDIDEILTGTDPFIASSSITALTPQISSGMMVSWETIKGKYYRLQQTTELNGVWQNVGEIHKGLGVVISAGIPFTNPQKKGFVRVAVLDIDSDNDGLSDWEETEAGLDPETSDTGATGEDDEDKMEDELGNIAQVTVRAKKPVANITQSSPGVFVVERSSSVGDVTVNYSLSGTATAGLDYQAHTGTVFMPSGQSSAQIEVIPLASSNISLSKSVVLTLTGDPEYGLGSKISQQINVIKEVALNVKDYGAVGDGVANDAPAIQSAITALEASSQHNTLYFPAGKYRLASITYTPHQNSLSYFRSLKLGTLDLSNRDIIFRGEQGSELYSTIGPTRCKMLMVMATFRSIHFSNMKWAKNNQPLASVNSGQEPNGATGIALVNVDNRVIEGFSVEDCEFNNCHRSITLSVSAITNNGKLRNFDIQSSKFLNPYGSNTVNPLNSYGGGQQVYVSSWVEYAEYNNNFFDGGGDGLPTKVSSAGRWKDGCHFGSPLNLVFKNNVVKRMGVEAVDQTNDCNRLGNTKHTFTIPAADGFTEVSVSMNYEVSPIEIGQHINFRTNAINTVLRVVSVDVANKKVSVVNDGFASNIAGGLDIIWNTPCYLQEYPPTHAQIYNNIVKDGSTGIVANSRGRIYNNLLYNSSITSYEEYRTPLFPADNGLQIDSNTIVFNNIVDESYYLNGIVTVGPNHRITKNNISFKRGSKCRGIYIGGPGNRILNNRILSEIAIPSSYSSTTRSLGITFQKLSSSDVFIFGNVTKNFEVGVGSAIPAAFIPYRVKQHKSINDVLPLDPNGLLPN